MNDSQWVPPQDGKLGYLVRRGEQPNSLPIMMLHGWSGDEKVMWVLQTTVPAGSTIVTPRAPLPIGAGGYQWIGGRDALNSSFEDYRMAIEALTMTVTDLDQRMGIDPAAWIMMGFSQGAATVLSYAVTTSLPQPAGLVILAGYAPLGPFESLQGIPVYWGHGTQDELIPLEHARSDMERLRTAGVDVSFCEAEVGHKVGVECTRGLKTWFDDHFPLSAGSS